MKRALDWQGKNLAQTQSSKLNGMYDVEKSSFSIYFTGSGLLWALALWHFVSCRPVLYYFPFFYIGEETSAVSKCYLPYTLITFAQLTLDLESYIYFFNTENTFRFTTSNVSLNSIVRYRWRKIWRKGHRSLKKT